MKKYWLSALFLCLLVIGACSDGDDGAETDADSPSTGDMAPGEELYQANNCIGCHGDVLQGGSGPALSNIGDELSADEIEEVIVEGRQGMPAGLVTDEDELETLVEWLSQQTEE